MKRILITGLIFVLLMSSAAYGANPASQDTFELEGLHDEVTVHYDSFGIPHIYATNHHDLYMVQGYITAQDRWWQMEWSRHQAKGELASIMGESLVSTDVFLRTIGLKRNAEVDLTVLSEGALASMEAYAEGVNAWILDKEPGDLAMEYNFAAMLGAEMEIAPWEPLDAAAFAQAMAILFERSRLENELLKMGLIEVGGPLAPLLLMPEYNYDRDPLISEPGWQPSELPPAAAPEAGFALNLDGFRYPTMPIPMFEEFGSNSWAISGDLTESGFPILANDPHISQGNPSVWYEVGLHCVEFTADCNVDSYGYSLPGVPSFVIGHNNHIAWGMTVSGLDTIDIYTLELNPENPNQYMFEGEWLDMDIITETIEVANGDPVEIEVRMTRFGPVIHELVGFEQPMAARLVAGEPSTAIEAFYLIVQARNWDDFQAAVAQFDFAGQNFIYADVDGNIGVVSGGRIPIRVEGHDGTVPVPGIDSSFDWQGFVDPMDNPRLFNPEQGYIVSANNAFVRPEDFPTVITKYYAYGQRAARIETLIQESEVHNIERTIAIQNDTYDPMGPYLLPALADIDLGDADLNDARDWLLEWDMRNDADSSRAALYNAIWMHLVPLAFDELELAGGVPGGSREMFLMRGMLMGEHPLWQNAALGTNDSAELLTMAFRDAWEMLAEALGDDPDSWRWDALHISNAKHTPFGQLPAGENIGLDLVINDIYRTFNRQIGVPGGLDNINNQRWDARNGHFELDGAIVSMRMIVDFSDFDNSRFIHELGQSGDPFSPHFDDMNPLWATGAYHPYGFTPGAVEAITARTVIYTPAE